jgi:hypothetical protein
MLQRSVGLLVMGLVLPGAAQPARTCIFMPALPHHVDAALQRSDASAPDKPVVVAVDTFRRNGMTCTRQSCVSNSCGSTGTVRIDLQPSADDATPPEQIGYRLTLVRGALPASMSGMLGVTLAGGRPIYLRPTFEELPSIHAELSAVAVDEAGNESEPTEPFAVSFDGCTLAAVGDRCEDEIDPDADLSSVLDADLLGDESDPEVFAGGASGGCSLQARALPLGTSGLGSAVTAFGLALGAAIRRRRRHRAAR